MKYFTKFCPSFIVTVYQRPFLFLLLLFQWLCWLFRNNMIQKNWSRHFNTENYPRSNMILTIWRNFLTSFLRHKQVWICVKCWCMESTCGKMLLPKSQILNINHIVSDSFHTFFRKDGIIWWALLLVAHNMFSQKSKF